MTIPFLQVKKSYPFAHVQYDKTSQFVTKFLDAVLANPDRAWAYVSRICGANLDLNQLQELIGQGVHHVPAAAYVPLKQNWLTRSMYVIDKDQNTRTLLHLHMVKEPDRNGSWKVFDMEQEYI